MTTYIPDHVARGLSHIVSQFARSERLRDVAAALLQQVQEIEDATLDVAQGITISGATGAQLDLLGRLFGEPRDGLPDEIYRRFISARLMIRLARGTPNSVMEIASVLLGTRVKYEGAYPAGYRLAYTIGATLPPSLLGRVKARIIEATPAGVGMTLVQSTSATPFTFDVDGLGFDSGELTEIV